MNTNHAKAIKGMSIANIVLAALGVVGMLIVWAGLGMGGAAISNSGYDYFYTDDGLYMDVDDINMLLGMLSFLVVLVLICAVLILIAGILGVRGADKPEKLRGVMIWNIVAAVVSLLSGCWVSLVLCIIVAVFANKDKNLAASGYGAAAYAAPQAYGYGAPQAPAAPQQPVVPQQPAAPAPAPAPVPTAAAAPAAAPAPAAVPVAAVAEEVVATEAAPAPVEVQETVAEGTFAPAETAAEAQAAAEAPAIILPDSPADNVMEGVTVVEVSDDAGTAEPASSEDADKPNA